MQQICSRRRVGRPQQLPSGGLFDELIDSGDTRNGSRSRRRELYGGAQSLRVLVGCRRWIVVDFTTLRYRTTSRVLIIGLLAPGSPGPGFHHGARIPRLPCHWCSLCDTVTWSTLQMLGDDFAAQLLLGVASHPHIFTSALHIWASLNVIGCVVVPTN